MAFAEAHTYRPADCRRDRLRSAQSPSRRRLRSTGYLGPLLFVIGSTASQTAEVFRNTAHAGPPDRPDKQSLGQRACMDFSGETFDPGAANSDKTYVCLGTTSTAEGQASILRRRARTRSGHAVVIAEHTTNGRSAGRTTRPLAHPNYLLPDPLEFEDRTGTKHFCILDAGAQTQTQTYTCEPSSPLPTTATGTPYPTRTSTPAFAVESALVNTQPIPATARYTVDIVPTPQHTTVIPPSAPTTTTEASRPQRRPSRLWERIQLAISGFFQSDPTENAVSQPHPSPVTYQQATQPEAASVPRSAQTQEACVQPVLRPYNEIIQWFGENPERYGPLGHAALDIVAGMEGTEGQPIRHALCSGIVTDVAREPTELCGSCSVTVENGPVRTTYLHTACPPLVAVGDRVTAETVLAYIGPDDPCSDGAHVHVQMLEDGIPIDPLSVLKHPAYKPRPPVR